RVECEYSPVRMLARLGQQSELTTNMFVKSTPCSTSSDRTFGMAHRVSHRWSSARMNTMFGTVGAVSGLVLLAWPERSSEAASIATPSLVSGTSPPSRMRRADAGSAMDRPLQPD